MNLIIGELTSNDYVIVAEVPKLKIPYNSSIKITDFKKDFYLYPYDIIKTLNKLNQNIRYYKNGREGEAEHHSRFSEVLDVDGKESVYFISEFDINIEDKGDEILEVVKNHFKHILNLFSFIFRELFYIKSVYIFKKKSTFYEFFRMIKIPIFHKETSNDSQLIQIVFRRDVEDLFPILLLRLKKNEKYLPFIEEYLFSRIRAGNIMLQFMVSWNTLEHLTNIYWKLRGGTKLFKKDKVEEINSLIKNINEDDIKFPFISLEEIKKRVSFHNRPPILILIREMCKKIHLKLDEDEFLTIRQVHYIRNNLFHRLYDISELNEDFSTKFKLKDFQTKDYGNLIMKFMLILDKILLRLFQFTPTCLKIIKSDQYFHHLEWKKINVYSKRKEIDINKLILNSRKKDDLSKLGNRDYIIKEFLDIKKKIFFRGKYISLLKFLDHLKERINYFLKKSIIIGSVDTQIHGKKKILLQFKENLKGIYYAKRVDDHTSVIFVQSSKFSSIPNEDYNAYQIRFELFTTEEFHNICFKREYIKIKGEFFTLLIDIKKNIFKI